MMTAIRIAARRGAFLGILLTVSAAWADGRGRPILLDAPFDATPHPVVAEMLRLAEAGPDDVVYDLGSGDGRIVIAAVRDFGVRQGVGVELDPRRVRQGRENARKAGVSDRARFVRGDVFRFDFRPATVLTLYMSARINRELQPRLMKLLRPGTRIVSYRWHIGDWPATTRRIMGGRDIRLYIVPPKVAGHWRWTEGGTDYRLDLEQDFRAVTGMLQAGGRSAPIADGRIDGERLRFHAKLGDAAVDFDGKVSGDAIDATLAGGAHVTARRVP